MRKIRLAPLSVTDQNKRTDHGPYLIVQERPRDCSNSHLIVKACDAENIERLDRGFRLTLG